MTTKPHRPVRDPEADFDTRLGWAYNGRGLEAQIAAIDAAKREAMREPAYRPVYAPRALTREEDAALKAEHSQRYAEVTGSLVRPVEPRSGPIGSEVASESTPPKRKVTAATFAREHGLPNRRAEGRVRRSQTPEGRHERYVRQVAREKGISEESAALLVKRSEPRDPRLAQERRAAARRA